MNFKRASLTLLSLCCLGHTAAALQDPEPEGENVPIELPGAVDQAQEEMLQLFRDIEQNLRKVDILLSDAGAGDTSGLAEVEEAGIGKLLEDSRERSEQVLKDIDRLLELAEQAGQQQSSSGSQSNQSQSQPQGSSSSQGSSQGGQQTTRREQTPERPGEEPSGQTPGEGEQPEGQQPGEQEQQPNQQGERPSDGQEQSNTDPSQRPANEPPTDPTGAGSPNDPASDRWGDLPVHVQDVFRGEDAEEM
ncbi:MAG: hypothetical protein MK291_05540, partial [Planctomycetes bacterium]|nr:hypothetical protein [Planctomycetota bacterium]